MDMLPINAPIMAPDEIVVVSGLPRSGTSMVMRMLDAGGMPVLADGIRTADEDNPRGYFEFQPVKRLKVDKEWVPLAVGKAVKVISFLLRELPPYYRYRVVFMRRALPEVMASQRKMMTRNGMPISNAAADDVRMTALFEKHLDEVGALWETAENMTVLFLDHAAVVARPDAAAAALNAFMGGQLDTQAMAGAVDPALHRQRLHKPA